MLCIKIASLGKEISRRYVLFPTPHKFTSRHCDRTFKFQEDFFIFAMDSFSEEAAGATIDSQEILGLSHPSIESNSEEAAGATIDSQESLGLSQLNIASTSNSDEVMDVNSQGSYGLSQLNINYEDVVKNGKMVIDVKDWKSLKSEIKQLGDKCMSADKLDFFKTTLVGVFGKIERTLVNRVQGKDERSIQAYQNRIQKVMCSLLESLQTDDAIAGLPAADQEPVTTEDVFKKIVFLKNKLSNPRSILYAHQIGELLHKLQNDIAKKREFYLLAKNKIGYSRTYVSFMIDVFHFTSIYKKLLTSTLSFHTFKRDYSTIKAGFELLLAADKDFWRVV